MAKWHFEWDLDKEHENLKKHGIDFKVARKAFYDPLRLIAEDQSHSEVEARYFCFGKVDQEIVTVRFTYRKGAIRIFGAGYWRKGKKAYERENSLH